MNLFGRCSSLPQITPDSFREGPRAELAKHVDSSPGIVLDPVILHFSSLCC